MEHTKVPIPHRQKGEPARFWPELPYRTSTTFHTLPFQKRSWTAEDHRPPSQEDRDKAANSFLDAMGVDLPGDPMRDMLKRGGLAIGQFHHTRVADAIKTTGLDVLTHMDASQFRSVDNVMAVYCLKKQAEDRRRMVRILLRMIKEEKVLYPENIRHILDNPLYDIDHLPDGVTYDKGTLWVPFPSTPAQAAGNKEAEEAQEEAGEEADDEL